MSFQGNISSLPLSDVLQNLAANKKVGTLSISSAGVERRIQFRDGKIISYTDDQGFSIAQWLADKEIISREDLDKALRRRRKAKKKSLGKILHDMGVLDLDDYSGYFNELVKETLYEVLSFQEGSFKFHEGNLEARYADGEARALGISIAAPNVMMESARRMDDWQRIRRHIPSENEIYHVAPADRKSLLQEADGNLTKEAIRLLDGTRSLREVIAKLPYSRFDACSSLAQLIAEKKVRPLDGSALMEGSGGNQDPEHLIACLKTILEREPNNRRILKRLADLHKEEGHPDESATHHKLLAISFLEDGDLDEAEESLRRSLELKPKDIGTWRKLWSVVLRQANKEKIGLVGREFADHFKKLGLMEIVRDHLREMESLFPQEADLKFQLAEARFALGERDEAVQGLFELARGYLRTDRLTEAEDVFVRILKYDRGNKKAQELYEKLHSGTLARRRKWRRKACRYAVLVLLVTASCGFLGYDFHARGELFQATRAVFADSLLENERYDEAMSKIRKVQETHPYSLTALFEARLLLEVLREKRGEEEVTSPGGAK